MLKFDFVQAAQLGSSLLNQIRVSAGFGYCVQLLGDPQGAGRLIAAHFVSNRLICCKSAQMQLSPAYRDAELAMLASVPCITR